MVCFVFWAVPSSVGTRKLSQRSGFDQSSQAPTRPFSESLNCDTDGAARTVAAQDKPSRSDGSYCNSYEVGVVMALIAHLLRHGM